MMFIRDFKDLKRYAASQYYGYYKSKEIPKNVPVFNYCWYIKKNMGIDADRKPESEWTDFDYKEVHSRELRLNLAEIVRDKFPHDKPLSERELRIVEYVRNGTDLDVPREQLAKLFE